jgi:hypothetical protein
MSAPEPQQALIDRLVADAQPVRRLWPPAARLGLWAGLVAVMLALVAWRHGWPFGAAVRPASLPAELLCAGLATAACALLALRAAIPGRAAGRGALLATAGLAVLPLAFWLHDPSPQTALPLAQFVAAGVPCAIMTALLAVLPLASLLWAVRRGAPLNPRRAGVLVGGGGFLAAYLLMRVFCAVDDPSHLMIWHVVPVALGIGLCAGLGGWWLARWRATPP